MRCCELPEGGYGDGDVVHVAKKDVEHELTGFRGVWCGVANDQSVVSLPSRL